MLQYKIVFISILFSFFALCDQPKDNQNSIKIDFKNISIKDFVHKISNLTEDKIILEKSIKGMIHFESTRSFSREELIPLLNKVMITKGVMLVATGVHEYSLIALYPPGCYNESPKIKNLISIKEQMYRYIFKKFGAERFDYYFLGTNKKDVRPDLLKRFGDTGIKVLPYSMARVGSLGEKKGDRKTLVHHKENGGGGILVSINCISQEREDKIQIAWSYYVNGLDSGADIATLILKNGCWKVVENRTIIVS